VSDQQTAVTIIVTSNGARLCGLAWKSAGVPLVYQFINGDLNSSSASFYEWGCVFTRGIPWVRIRPPAGDVAVYGLDTSTLVAQHVAIVASFTPGRRAQRRQRDGDHTGFSRSSIRRTSTTRMCGTGTALLAVTSRRAPRCEVRTT